MAARLDLVLVLTLKIFEKDITSEVESEWIVPLSIEAEMTRQIA